MINKKKTKNIQLINGSSNCCYLIYSISEENFNLIFPNSQEGQDIEFAKDFYKRVGKRVGNKVLRELWENEVDRKLINGIHGTLFDDYEDCDCGKDIAKKKKHYLSKN